MHGKLCQTDIHCFHRNLGIGNISQCGAACHIRTVHKGLIRHLCPVTDIFENCSGHSVCTIFLICIVLDHDSPVQHRTVYRIRLIRIVWMESMGIICRNHKTVCKCHIIFLLGASQSHIDPHQSILQESRSSALSCTASHLFIIQHTMDSNTFLTLSLKKSFQRRKCTLQIIQSGCRDKFLIYSPQSTRSSVIKKQIMSQNIFRLYICGLSHSFHKSALSFLITEKRQHILLHIIFISVIYFPVHMNGKIGNNQQISVHSHHLLSDFSILTDNQPSCH